MPVHLETGTYCWFTLQGSSEFCLLFNRMCNNCQVQHLYTSSCMKGSIHATDLISSTAFVQQLLFQAQHLCIVQQLLYQAQHLSNSSNFKQSICATALISTTAFVQQLLYQAQHLCNRSYFKHSICAPRLISSKAFVQQLLYQAQHLCNSRRADRRAGMG